MSNWTKLFSSLLASSVWNLDDQTRILWITMLALREQDNVVRASVGGLAYQARIPIEACRKALDILESPDPDDRSGVKEGRRIEKVDGGWLLVNAATYRERRDADHRREYLRDYQRARRQKLKLASVNKNVNNRKQSKLCKPSRAEQSRAETEGAAPVNNSHEPETAKPAEPVSDGKPSLSEFLAGGYQIGISEPDCKILWEEWSAADWCFSNGEPIVKWRHRLLTWRNKGILPSQRTNGSTNGHALATTQAAFKPDKAFVENYFKSKMRYGGWGELAKFVQRKLVENNFVWRGQPIRDQEHAQIVMEGIADLWKQQK